MKENTSSQALVLTSITNYARLIFRQKEEFFWENNKNPNVYVTTKMSIKMKDVILLKLTYETEEEK